MANTTLDMVTDGDLARAIAKEARIMAAGYGDGWTADELLQEMWFALATKLDSDPAFLDQNTVSYILTYATSRARDMVRHYRDRVKTLERNAGNLVEIDAQVEQGPDFADLTPSTRNTETEALDRVALQEMASRLDAKAAAVLWGFLAGLTNKEMGALAGRSAAWVTLYGKPQVLAVADAYYAEV